MKRDLEKQIQRSMAGMTDSNDNVDEVTKAQVERLRAQVETVDQSIQREGQATNTKLKQMKEIIDNQSENRLNELKRLLEKQINDSKMAEDQSIRITIHDKLEESQRQQDREFEDKLQSAVNNTLSKAKAEAETQVSAAIKATNDKFHARLVDDQNNVNQRFNKLILETTQNIINDWNAKFEQMDGNFANLRKHTSDEIEARLAAGAGGAGSMDDVNRAIDSIRANWQITLDKHDQQIAALESSNKAMENEFDNMINIKVSNATRNINKSMGEKIREITDQHQN